MRKQCLAIVSEEHSSVDEMMCGDGTRTDLGQRGDVVAKLTSALPKHQNYKVNAENLFTSIPFLRKLADDGIYYTGTVRQNRLPGISIAKETDPRKKGCGSYDYQVNEERSIAAARWYDNRGVTMLSTAACLDPIQTIKRWDKKQKKE
ncbi:piggyBac transposable element-derived protein 3-like [Watersipora subatra]|uniref:piggyBac transposable element-derived protein 3-like n=1 Tax=Watersipora subatra TaxID=2589382 RepID=UPI00355B9FA0